jgi:hypothetical protein
VTIIFDATKGRMEGNEKEKEKKRFILAARHKNSQPGMKTTRWGMHENAIKFE